MAGMCVCVWWRGGGRRKWGVHVQRGHWPTQAKVICMHGIWQVQWEVCVKAQAGNTWQGCGEERWGQEVQKAQKGSRCKKAHRTAETERVNTGHVWHMGKNRTERGGGIMACVCV